MVLIRHGEAICNVRRRGRWPRGMHRAVADGEAPGRGPAGSAGGDRRARRRRRAVHAACWLRALETGGIAAAGIGDGTAPVQDCDLCELHPGEADGLTWDEFRVRYGEPDFDVDPDSRGGARG